MTRHGVNFSVLTADEVSDLEPKLNRNTFTRGVLQPGSGFVNYPMALAQAYMACALQRGAEHIQESVREVRPAEGDRVSIRTDEATRHFDSAVVAAGAWSKQFAAQLGDTSAWTRSAATTSRSGPRPINCFTVPSAIRKSSSFCRPCMTGFPWSAAMNWRAWMHRQTIGASAPSIPLACNLLPGITGQTVQREWMGFRPSTPDSLPVIGRSPRCKNVFYAFGHGHVGLTLVGHHGPVGCRHGRQPPGPV
jgi:D-amino-acid dehydrogenase